MGIHGIRARLVLTYLLIITLTVAAIEIVAIWAVNEYYIGNIESLLKNQSENAANFYKGYLSNTEIESNTGKFLDNLESVKAQIQVIDINGKVIADSVHETYGKTLEYQDVKLAMKGMQGIYKGKDAGTGEEILSVSVPLMSKDKIVGAARFTTSLVFTRKVISGLVFYFLLVGIIIILIIFFISLYLSHTITVPIKKITQLSREIAKGNLEVRAEKGNKDEIGVLSESINHMADEIQKTDKLKNEFISSISHELKTPLTSIKGWAVTLDDTQPEDFDIIKRGIYIINSETDRLTDMVEELLDFSRLQSGRFSLRIENVNINKLMLDVFEQMKPRADRHNVKLEISISNKVFMLKVDERRIRQVLINLLDNSLKFTPAGGSVKATAGLSESEDKSETSIMNDAKNENYYKIIVEDNGCGIDDSELPLLKNRFFRGRNAENENGIGLGLSICDELVKSHGGSIDIFSETGKGTKVVVMLPVS